MRRRLANAISRLRGRPLIPPHVTVGRDVYLGRTVALDWRHGHLITIGDGATVVDGTRVLCHDASSQRRLGLTWVAPVTIGRGAFIGADSLIMPGVIIGDDAVVAAGSVVTGDVAAGSIVAGVPARVIGSVDELDAERRKLAATRPVFSVAAYHDLERTPQKTTELREAARTGGYFLSAR